MLVHFGQDPESTIHTDASIQGLKAVLLQLQDGVHRAIVYASQTLSKAEANYSTTGKECLAAVWFITKYKPYLYERHLSITRDHHWSGRLTSSSDPSGCTTR